MVANDAKVSEKPVIPENGNQGLGGIQEGGNAGFKSGSAKIP